MAAVMPLNRVFVQKRPFNAVEIGCSSKLWLDLFPQHGPGPKHTRKIELVPRQERAIARYPWQFLRGLVHSDGCRVINRVNSGEYPRYFFTQVSETSAHCSAMPAISSKSSGNRTAGTASRSPAAVPSS
jgi:hypothetical protein